VATKASTSGAEPGPPGLARAWSQTTIKIGLGNFSSIETSFGATRDCEDDPDAIKKAQDDLHKMNEKQIERAMKKYKALEGEVGYGG